MRIKIEPITGFFGEIATHMSSDNHRLVGGRMISTVALWSNAGKKLAEKDMPMEEADFATWKADPAPVKTDDVTFVEAHLRTLAITAAAVEVIEEPVIIPETPEEEAARLAEEAKQAEAQRLADIADLEQRLADTQAELDRLKAVKPAGDLEESLLP